MKTGLLQVAGAGLTLYKIAKLDGDLIHITQAIFIQLSHHSPND